MIPDKYQPATERIIQYIRDGFGEEFNSYFEGDPVQIGESSLPAIVISKVAGEITQAATGKDRITESVLIKVILNKKDDFGAGPFVDLTDRRLRRYIEDRDPATGMFSPNSVLGILRHNFTLGNNAIDMEVATNYGVDLRPNEVITAEAHVTVTVQELVTVINRV